jgi:outer membrane immunogenic protein
MRRISLVVLTAAALVGALPGRSASAADLSPVYKAPQVVPAVGWTGFFIGGNIGEGWGRAADPGFAFVDSPAVPFSTIAGLGGLQYPNLSPRGTVAGGQLGYNWQSGTWVLGAVADMQASEMKASGSNIVTLLGTATVQSISAQENWLATVRGRLGFAANNWLVYGTGGLAVGEVNSTLGFSIPTPALGGTFAMAGSQTTTKVGWAAGAGVEYALTRNWSLGAEYLHFDLGRDTVTATPVVNTTPLASGGASLSATQRFSGDIGRALVNYRF